VLLKSNDGVARLNCIMLLLGNNAELWQFYVENMDRCACCVLDEIMKWQCVKYFSEPWHRGFTESVIFK